MGHLTASFTGANGVARRLSADARMLDSELHRALGDAAQASVTAFRPFEQRRTGRMRRGTTARLFGKEALVTVHAQNPQTGFDYVGVMRFGHRVARIRVRNAKALGPIPGIGFRHSVRGYKPRGDWRDRALPGVQRRVNLVFQATGRRIQARL